MTLFTSAEPIPNSNSSENFCGERLLGYWCKRTNLHLVYNVRTLRSFGKQLKGKKPEEASSLPQLLYFLKCLLPETPEAPDKALKKQKMVSRVLTAERILDFLIKILLCSM